MLIGSCWRAPSTLIFRPCPSSLSSQEIDSREIYHIYLKQIYHKAKSSLENARKDGHICFKSQNTRRDMTVLAATCQKLAKFPNLCDYGPELLNRFFIFTKIKQTGRDPIGPMIVDGIPQVCGIK
jgi:hypothetical protein